jgi:chromosome partitioning protein
MGTLMTDRSASTAEARVVTRGFIGEFGVATVLQALSLSRQYTAVVLFTDRGEPAGRVTLKSGMVIDASITGQDLTGAEAFRELVARPLHSFQVERLPPLATYPVPIGRLATHLLGAVTGEASAIESEPQKAAPGSARQPIGRSVPDDRDAPPASVPRLGNVAPKTSPVAAPQRAAGSGSAPVLAIASPKGGCGKTTVALNLAVSLAKSGLRVVLVDADPNGDVLSAIGARDRPRQGGIFDAFERSHDGSEYEIPTRIERLRVVPATGGDAAHRVLPDTAAAGAWQAVFRGIRDDADLVIVDLPAGMHGLSSQVMDACTHVLGVLQAETIPKRSFSMFQKGLEQLPQAPQVVGVVLNMFRRSHSASLSVLVDAGIDLPPAWLLETTIPRNDAFLDAAEDSMPVALASGNSAAFIALLFDALAKEVGDRMKLAKPEKAKTAGSFLV